MNVFFSASYFFMLTVFEILRHGHQLKWLMPTTMFKICKPTGVSHFHKTAFGFDILFSTTCNT